MSNNSELETSFRGARRVAVTVTVLLIASVALNIIYITASMTGAI